MNKTICLALTGASGMPYGLRLLECLLAAGCHVQLLCSQAAQVVARQEVDLDLPTRPAEARAALLARYPAVDPKKLVVFGREEWFAPVASGTNPPDAMVVCPCSMGTLSAIHLENMLRLARAGAVILPPSPGFYHHPQTVADLVDFVVARILDQLAIPHALLQRWGE
jgi:4-hydroxy-3-polyprenylbenzoate decarboxylase